VIKSTLTVAIAIDDPEPAERVRDMLADRRGFDLVAEDDERKVDVLITDTPGEWGGEPADAAVLVLTEASKAADAFRMGATAVLPVDVGARALRAAIHAAAAGLTTLPAPYLHALVGDTGRHEAEIEDDAAASLSARELQVLQLLAAGASNKAIARRLGISPNTAKFHVATISGKLGASGRTDAVAKAMRLGLVMI
jgi:two-component system, NarL family, nitrate/nitrite response regulator NarL